MPKIKKNPTTLSAFINHTARLLRNHLRTFLYEKKEITTQTVSNRNKILRLALLFRMQAKKTKKNQHK